MAKKYLNNINSPSYSPIIIKKASEHMVWEGLSPKTYFVQVAFSFKMKVLTLDKYKRILSKKVLQKVYYTAFLNDASLLHLRNTVEKGKTQNTL